MRALEVLGLSGDGAQLVVTDPQTGEEFGIAADDKLRAAARGDVTRIGQLEIEMESQLRPKDIQARIRAGATVAEVAAAAGTSTGRVERFAYPVLMERSAMAQRGVNAHPVGPHGPATISIGEVVAATLTTRGHKGVIDWDAYKCERGWVLVASWKAGRSENSAAYLLHQGANGGTVTPRDDFAKDLLDPAPKPLRTVSAEIPAPGEPTDISATQRIPKITDAMLVESVTKAARPAPPVAPTTPVPTTSVKAAAKAEPHTETRPSAPSPQLTKDEPDGADVVERTVADDRSGAAGRSVDEIIARTGTEGAPPRARNAGKGKPSMPSWDDVLLGSGLKRG